MRIRTITTPAWKFYLADETIDYNPDKVGKWMYRFDENGFNPSDLCKFAIAKGIVKSCKHSNASTGVCCFYTEIDDKECHKRILNFFIKNNMIRKTKSGRFYNIGFKLDSQTLRGEYGSDFKPNLQLVDFIDLDTGRWLEEGEQPHKTYAMYLKDVKRDYENLKNVPLEFRDEKMCLNALYFHDNAEYVLNHLDKKMCYSFLNKKELKKFISLIPKDCYTKAVCQQLFFGLNQDALCYIPKEALTEEILRMMVENEYRTAAYIPKEWQTPDFLNSLLDIRGVKTVLKKAKMLPKSST